MQNCSKLLFSKEEARARGGGGARAQRFGLIRVELPQPRPPTYPNTHTNTASPHQLPLLPACARTKEFEAKHVQCANPGVTPHPRPRLLVALFVDALH